VLPPEADEDFTLRTCFLHNHSHNFQTPNQEL
jgi:hypothetical protein